MPAAESDISAQQSAMLGAVSPEPTAARAADRATDLKHEPDAEPSPPRKKPEPKLCGVCGTQPGKYKCPRCSLPYCSVSCNKQHKENHPPDPPKPEPSPTAPDTSQPDPAQHDPYSHLLEHRGTFQRIFEIYPNLAAELTRIQAATLPPSDGPNSMFSMGANTGRNKNQPWTKEVGLRRGVQALRKARTNPTDTGDGVREFCEVLRWLLSQKGEGVEKVREEVAAEETRAIERLLREEGG